MNFVWFQVQIGDKMQVLDRMHIMSTNNLIDLDIKVQKKAVIVRGLCTMTCGVSTGGALFNNSGIHPRCVFIRTKYSATNSFDKRACYRELRIKLHGKQHLQYLVTSKL